MNDFRPNRIRQAFESRLARVLAAKGESESIEHASSQGALREGYLREFVSDLLSANRLSTSGFIVDIAGNISPQIDLVVASNVEAPAVLLGQAISLVPIETVVCWVEVKSTLKTEHLEQIRRQASAVNSMSSVAGSFAVPFCLICYETKVAETTIKNSLEDTTWLQGVCVLEEHSLVHNPSTGDVNRLADGSLSFFAQVLSFLGKAEQEREYPESLISLYLSLEENHLNRAT